MGRKGVARGGAGVPRCPKMGQRGTTRTPILGGPHVRTFEHAHVKNYFYGTGEFAENRKVLAVLAFFNVL